MGLERLVGWRLFESGLGNVVPLLNTIALVYDEYV
jgi:hypothetical protein